jgi:hypothetical protein
MCLGGDLDMEQWKPVRGFEGVYEVSDQGRVRNIVGYHRWFAGRILKPYDTGRGYLQVRLCNIKAGKKVSKALHRLVAETFIPNPKHLPQVNHLGTKSDCRAFMLEWCTKRGNEKHAMKNELKGDGVYLDKKSGKWAAHYSPKPYAKEVLGLFKTKRKALAVRRAAIKETFCEGDTSEDRP